MRLLAALLLVPVVARGVTVEPLPPSEYADTEVSTNMPFAVSLDSMSRLEFTLSLDASSTNSVEALPRLAKSCWLRASSRVLA